jgi:hypothetical protein
VPSGAYMRAASLAARTGSHVGASSVPAASAQRRRAVSARTCAKSAGASSSGLSCARTSAGVANHERARHLDGEPERRVERDEDVGAEVHPVRVRDRDREERDREGRVRAVLREDVGGEARDCRRCVSACGAGEERAHVPPVLSGASAGWKRLPPSGKTQTVSPHPSAYAMRHIAPSRVYRCGHTSTSFAIALVLSTAASGA